MRLIADREGVVGWDLGKSEYTKGTDYKAYTDINEILELKAMPEMKRIAIIAGYDKVVDEIAIYARVDCDAIMEPLGPEVDLEEETNVPRDKLESLLEEGQDKLDKNRISKEGLKEVQEAMKKAQALLADPNAEQVKIDGIYNRLNILIVKYTTEDFTGRAYVEISGFDKDGKRLEGNGFNSNLGLIYFDNGREVSFMEHNNKIENIDISQNNKFTFKVAYRGGEKLNMITHNGKKVDFEDVFGYETKKITIELAEGLNEIVIDYRPEREAFNKQVSTDEAKELIDQDKDLVIFDVRTQGEFNESHIKNAINSDFYKSEEFNSYLDGLEKHKTYLIYCRTQTRSKQAAEQMATKGFKYVYWMNGGMTDWLEENKAAVFSQAPKQLDIELTSNIKNDKAEIAIKVTNIEFPANPMVKAKVSLKLLKDGKILETRKLNLDNQESQLIEVSLAEVDEIRAIAKQKGYKDGEIALKLNEAKLKAFDISENQFKHLEDGLRERMVIENLYGKRISKYKVLDMDEKEIALDSRLDSQKPTILVFGYPGCGGCVEMMKEISNFIKMNEKLLENFNYLEIITSVNMENPKETIDFTKQVIEKRGLENIAGHIVYDASEYIWANRLGLQTTPNVVLLDKEGRMVNISPRIIPSDLKDLLKATFNIDLGNEIPDPVSYKE